MDFTSSKTKMKENFSNNIKQLGLAMFLFLMVFWLIAISVQNQALKDEIGTIKKETDAKSKTFHEKTIRLVNKNHHGDMHISGLVEDSVTEDIWNEIYTKVGDYGYFFKFDKVVNFYDAERSCKDINGHVVEFNETDPNVQDFLMTLKRKFTPSFWIGLKDQSHHNVLVHRYPRFQWLKNGSYFSRSPLAMNLWSTGQPDNLGSERCVATDLKSKNSVTIMNVNCDEYFSHVICQKNT